MKKTYPEAYRSEHFEAIYDEALGAYVIYRLEPVKGDGFLFGRSCKPEYTRIVLEAVEHAFQMGAQEASAEFEKNTEKLIIGVRSKFDKPIHVPYTTKRARKIY